MIVLEGARESSDDEGVGGIRFVAENHARQIFQRWTIVSFQKS